MDAPWGHPVISQLIKSQWWGHRAEGSRYGSSPNNPFLNAPICQMALVATAVSLKIFFFCPLAKIAYRRSIVSSPALELVLPWSSMSHCSGPSNCSFILHILKSVVDFWDRWHFYMTMLKEFQKKSPSYLKMVQSKIQEETG